MGRLWRWLEVPGGWDLLLAVGERMGPKGVGGFGGGRFDLGLLFCPFDRA